MFLGICCHQKSVGKRKKDQKQTQNEAEKKTSDKHKEQFEQ
jgi:hypothetical protein